MTVSYDGEQTCEQRSLVVRTCYGRTDRNYAMECAAPRCDPAAQPQRNQSANRSCGQSWLAPTRPAPGRRRTRAQQATISSGFRACRRAIRPTSLPTARAALSRADRVCPARRPDRGAGRSEPPRSPEPGRRWSGDRCPWASRPGPARSDMAARTRLPGQVPTDARGSSGPGRSTSQAATLHPSVY
jgi:hypothetical protein